MDNPDFVTPTDFFAAQALTGLIAEPEWQRYENCDLLCFTVTRDKLPANASHAERLAFTAFEIGEAMAAERLRRQGGSHG